MMETNRVGVMGIAALHPSYELSDALTTGKNSRFPLLIPPPAKRWGRDERSSLLGWHIVSGANDVAGGGTPEGRPSFRPADPFHR
jgi:hypothetical protein